jgi:hypothetical protein
MSTNSFGDVCQAVMQLLPPTLEIDPSVCDLGLTPDLDKLHTYQFARPRLDGTVPEVFEDDFWGMVLQGGYGQYGLGLLNQLWSVPYMEWPASLMSVGDTLVFGGAKLRRKDRLFVATLAIQYDLRTERLVPVVGAKWTGSPYWPYQAGLLCEA